MSRPNTKNAPRHLTVKIVQAAIDKMAASDPRYVNVEFVKGKGYYYLAPKDTRAPWALDTAHSTTIYIYALNHAPLATWMDHIAGIMEKAAP
jgi:hypothetical protein